MAQQQPHESTTDVILTAVDDTIRAAVRKHIPRNQRDDVEQDTRLHLLTCIERYDPARGHPIEHFLRRCIRNFVIEQARQSRRQRRTAARLEYDPVGPDTSHDRQIEQLAAMILSSPHAHINSHFRAELLTALAEQPDAPRGAVADLLGVDVKQIWHGTYRLREEITAVFDAKSA